MDYINLGKTGLKVSRICLGCMTYGEPATGELKGGRHAWALNEEESQPFLRAALDLGINFFDTANVYSSGASETVVGRFLKANARREAVVIATKVQGVMRDEPNGRGLSRKAIFFELDESLRRLGTDYVDLYQIHRFDYETPIEETLEALHDLVKSGKVRYIGASSMFAWQFTKALYLADLHGWTRFVSMQNHYNLLYREEEREMIPLCRVRRHRRHSLESAGAWPPRPPLAKRKHQTLRNRSIREEDVLADRGDRPECCGPTGAACRTAWRSTGTDGAGLVAQQAGDHCADCRRHQAAPSSGRGCSAVAAAEARRDRFS